MEEAEELFDQIINDNEELAIAGQIETGLAEISTMEIEEEAVATFSSRVLESAGTFKNWVVSGLKSLSVSDVVMIGTGVLMLYEMIHKQASQAQETGKRIKLSAAIDGAKQTMVNKYDQTIRAVAQKVKNDSAQWNKLSSTMQTTINSEIAMSGDVYWLECGETIMQKLAEMPIYDPTP